MAMVTCFGPPGAGRTGRGTVAGGGMSGVVFYISAHQDDWQLFRGERAYRDLRAPGLRVVFVYTTAGDSGDGPGASWWRARERGALASCLGAQPEAKRYGETWTEFAGR